MTATTGVGVLRHRLVLTGAVPRVGTSFATAGGSVVSLAPSLLPRSPIVQGVVTGLLVAALWGATALAGRLRGGATARPSARLVAAAVSVAAVGWATATAHRWQNALRDAMALPPIGPAHWALVGFSAVTVCLLAFGVTRAVVTAACRLGRLRCTALIGIVVPLAWSVAVPLATSSAAEHFRSTSSVVDTSLVAHEPDSLVPWASLGAEGRRFVAGASHHLGVRVYVGLDSAPDVESRAALAVRELARTGGFARQHVVVAIPTGSGWIDGEAARGIEQRFGGDVAIVGQQYSYAPSWVTFLFGRADAQRSARALFDAVSAHVATMPADARPDLHVYGQSLGAVGGSAIVTGRTPGAAAPCSVLWAGPPAGQVESAGVTVLANSSDPVVWWSPALLVRSPDLSRVRIDAPVPQWIPVVSFLQTTVDTVSSLEAPVGHGHRYGVDQGARLGGCT